MPDGTIESVKKVKINVENYCNLCMTPIERPFVNCQRESCKAPLEESKITEMMPSRMKEKVCGRV